MKVIKNGLSEKLMILISNWLEEHENNHAHCVHDNFAWNELVSYLMELEKGKLEKSS